MTEGEAELTVFLRDLRQIISHPQGQLDTLSRHLKGNEVWIRENRREIGDSMSESDLSDLHGVIDIFRQSRHTNQSVSTAAFWLYHILLNLLYEGTFKQPLLEYELVEVLARHLEMLQPHYRQDEVSSSSVFCV